MKDPELTFVIPTYRLRDVAETVDAYDEHFGHNGHDVRIVVFDDGTVANREKYCALLDGNATYNPVYYVGPQEKERFLGHVATRLRDKKLGALVRTLFRPSYGGNPPMDSHPESLGDHEIAHGRLLTRWRTGAVTKSFDLLFLADEQETDIDALNAVYILSNFRPAITNKAWRMDCGVAGYDNTFGLPPFFPTRLRFEDYSYRLWAQHEGVASAHVDAVQTHAKSNYMRNPPADEIFNEEVANLLKRKIKNTLTCTNDLGFRFDYDGEVTPNDCAEILERISGLHSRSLAARERTSDETRAAALHTFGVNLRRAFYDFEPDFFQQNLARLVDDVVTEIKASLEVWPTLIEICFFEKSKRGLPQTRVNNQRLR